MTKIQLQNISKVYGSGSSAAQAVDGVNLTIDSGEFFFLLGPSGCGKTTLLRMIAGMIDPTGGRILFNGLDVTGVSVEHRQTAMVFQNYALWPHMTVAKNVEFGPKMRGLDRNRRRELAADSLARVQMDAYAHRKPNQLSGGQQQRVALARALAAQPNCLLLDEPLSNLDARLRLHMRTELRKLVKTVGATGVYVTHDQKEALSMADRIAVMDAGRIVQVGAPAELYNRPATRFVADFLGEANFLDAKVLHAGAKAILECPQGRLFAATEDSAFSGDRVTCCVRPERIALSPQPDLQSTDTLCALPGRVEAVIYLGEMLQYVCRLDEQTRWKVSILACQSRPLAEGQAVSLQFLPADVTVLTQ